MATTNPTTGTLIKDGQVVSDDAWTHLSDEDPLPASGPYTVSFDRFKAAPIEVDKGRAGIRFDPTDDPRELEEHLGDVGLITVAFPKFTDGRGYSIARLLRDELGYQGELRALGDILPDQMFYLRRCGFDAMVLAAGKDPAHALEALGAFSVRYQAAADEPRPLYAREDRS